MFSLVHEAASGAPHRGHWNTSTWTNIRVPVLGRSSRADADSTATSYKARRIEPYGTQMSRYRTVL
jgi:hypothetical protein